MTAKEKEKIEEIMTLLHDMSQKQEVMGHQLDRVDRFIYGDPENGVDGLVVRQKKDEDRLDKLEQDIKIARTLSKFLGNHIGKVLAAIITALLAWAGASAEKIQKVVNSFF